MGIWRHLVYSHNLHSALMYTNITLQPSIVRVHKLFSYESHCLIWYTDLSLDRANAHVHFDQIVSAKSSGFILLLYHTSLQSVI